MDGHGVQKQTQYSSRIVVGLIPVWLPPCPAGGRRPAASLAPHPAACRPCVRVAAARRGAASGTGGVVVQHRGGPAPSAAAACGGWGCGAGAAHQVHGKSGATYCIAGLSALACPCVLPWNCLCQGHPLSPAFPCSAFSTLLSATYLPLPQAAGGAAPRSSDP